MGYGRKNNSIVKIDYKDIQDKMNSNTAQLENTVKDLEQRSINVKLSPFNAKGDGVDDTQAIQDALTYASLNTNKKLYFPSGTYYSTLPISVFDNLTIEGAGVSTVLKFATGINGVVGTGTFKNISLKNLKLQGTNVANAIENGINFVGDSGGFPKLVIQNLQISDFGNIGMYLENCWDGAVENVNLSGNKSHGGQFVNCFSLDMKKIVAYYNKGRGLYIQSAAGSLFTGTSQENEKEGILVESAKGCTFEMYLEQNGWNTTTDNEKAQFRLTQRSGGFKPSSGNTLNLYVLGGKGSTSPVMESKYGIYIDYGYQNTVNGNLGGHLTSDIYLTSNSSNNTLGTVEYETGQVGGDTPTPLTNNGSMNGYVLKSTNKNSRIESLSYASQTAARAITFTKPFVIAPKIVGTVVGSTSTADMTVKIANVTTTGFDFVVTDGAAYVNAVQVNFIAIGE